jgi:hypothetical protein
MCLIGLSRPGLLNPGSVDIQDQVILVGVIAVGDTVGYLAASLAPTH